MSRFLSSYALLILLLGLLILALTGNLFSANPFVIAGQVVALAITVSARITFARNAPQMAAFPGKGPLLDKGPYRFIRHPMYAGAALFLLVSLAGHPSLLSFLIVLAILVLIIARIEIEERLLISHYPEYSMYTRRTRRLIPFLY